MTPSDRFGHWKENLWLESPMFDQLRGGANIFQALIRGAEANFAMADVGLDIKANKSDFSGIATEKISRGIYEILDQVQWTEKNQQALFYAMILKLNAFVISRMNGGAGQLTKPVPEFSDMSVEMGGNAICQECYSAMEFTSASDMTCSECGGETLVMQEPEVAEHSIVNQFRQEDAGFPEIVVADALDVSVDDSAHIPNEIASSNGGAWRQIVSKY
jgi:hypothetical protein